MTKLQQLITKASQDYYSKGTSDLSDSEFDSLLNELKQENPNDPLLTQTGHGYDIELDTSFGDKVTHTFGHANSLDKCHDYEEYHKFVKHNDQVWASLKLDGMSVVLYYNDGVLTSALTRGDGIIGIDITSKIKHIAPYALQIPDKTFTGAVRGELVMSYSDFEEYKDAKLAEDPEAKISNARNTCVGLVKGSNNEQYAKYVSLVVYNVVGYVPAEDEIESPWEASKVLYSKANRWLSENFQKVVFAEVIKFTPTSFLSEMESLRNKWYGYYPADGIVLMYTEGHINEFEPNKWSISYDSCAFKFPAETKTSTVINVDWNLSKTKYLIPRVNFETVELSGAQVSWAHGDNAKNIINNKIGKGAKVEVTRRGEVIPHIEQVLEPGEVEIPTHCPCCGAELQWDSLQLVCPNRECSDSEIKDVLVWCDNIAPVDGLGDILRLRFLGEMLGEDNITINNIYNYEIPSDGPATTAHGKLFDKMYSMLRTRKVDLLTAIKALNIPRLGDKNAEKLAQFPDLVKGLASGTLASISPQDRKQIGDANCNSILDNAWKFKRLNLIADNIDWSIKEQVEIIGKVVITGKLSVKRDSFEAELRSKGYVTAGSVTKDTMCLITDNPNSGSSKNQQADKFDIMKLTESEFRERYLQ